jgi:hypothetical protein
MYNRKFNIKQDFSKLNELENLIIPLLNKVEEDQRDMLKKYVRETFKNQWKQ